MVKRKKRKFGSAILIYDEDKDEYDSEEYFGYDTESEDEDPMNMDVRYQENRDVIGLGGDVKDQIARIEASKNSEADLSDAYLGDRSHEQNVNIMEDLSENMQELMGQFENGKTDSNFNLYEYAWKEKLNFLDINNTVVFKKLKNKTKTKIDILNKKIKIIKGLIEESNRDYGELKTNFFKKDIKNKIKRLNTELTTIKIKISEINNYFEGEREEFKKFKITLQKFRNFSTEKIIKKHKYYLSNIFDKNEKKRQTEVVDFSNMSIKEIEEDFLLKPINKGVELHNSVFSKYKSHDVEKTSDEYNDNVYKRYNLLENLNIEKTSSKENFFRIMGKCQLTEHIDSIIRVDKKHRRIIYDNVISFISSFYPDDKIDSLLEDTSSYNTEKYIVGFEYINSNYFPSNQFENKSYEFTRFKMKGEKKEKESNIFQPVIGWIYKEDALKSVEHNKETTRYNNS